MPKCVKRLQITIWRVSTGTAVQFLPDDSGIGLATSLLRLLFIFVQSLFELLQVFQSSLLGEYDRKWNQGRKPHCHSLWFFTQINGVCGNDCAIGKRDRHRDCRQAFPKHRTPDQACTTFRKIDNRMLKPARLKSRMVVVPVMDSVMVTLVFHLRILTEDDECLQACPGNSYREILRRGEEFNLRYSGVTLKYRGTLDTVSLQVPADSAARLSSTSSRARFSHSAIVSAVVRASTDQLPIDNRPQQMTFSPA